MTSSNYWTYWRRLHGLNISLFLGQQSLDRPYIEAERLAYQNNRPVSISRFYKRLQTTVNASRQSNLMSPMKFTATLSIFAMIQSRATDATFTTAPLNCCNRSKTRPSLQNPHLVPIFAPSVTITQKGDFSHPKRDSRNLCYPCPRFANTQACRTFSLQISLANSDVMVIAENSRMVSMSFDLADRFRCSRDEELE